MRFKFLLFSILAFLIILNGVKADIKSDVIHYWSFDQTSTPAIDTLDGANFTLGAGSSAAGKINNSWTITVAEQINTSGVTSLTSGTVAYWVKPSDPEYFLYSDNAGANTVISFGQAVTGTQYGIYDGTDWRATGLGYTSDGAWQHHVWVFNATNSTATFYFDGSYVSTFAYDGTMDFSGDISINFVAGASYALQAGNVDEFYIYDRGLSESDVLTLYTTTNQYPFDIFSLITLKDTFNETTILDFNATISNLTFNASNSSNVASGELTFFNKTGKYNITITKDGYFNKTFQDVTLISEVAWQGNLSRGTVRVETAQTDFNVTLIDTATGNIIFTNSTDSNLSLSFFGGNFTNNITVNVTKDRFTYYTTSFINNQTDEYFNAFLLSDPSIINITIYDETTNSLISSPVSLELIGGVSSANFSNTTGILYLDNITGGEYELIYTSPDYNTRRYYLTLPSDSYISLRLYLLNTSNSDVSLILYEVTDENGVSLSNVTIQALRFFVSENAFRVVETSISDSNGEGGLYLEKINPKYKFLVFQNGNLILTTVPAQVFKDTLLLRSDLSEDVIESLVAVIGIQKSLTFSNVTNSFTLTYSDPTGLVDEVCFYVTKENIRSRVTVNETCISGSAGSATLGIGANKTGQYIARATLETNTEFSPAILTELAIILGAGVATFGGIAIIGTIFIILGLSLTLIFVTNSAIGGIMGAVLGIIISSFIGILSVGLPVIIGIVIIGILVMIITRPRGAT